MRWGRFFNSLRCLKRQPVVSTPIIGNAFELNSVYKPIKHECIPLLGIKQQVLQQEQQELLHQEVLHREQQQVMHQEVVQQQQQFAPSFAHVKLSSSGRITFDEPTENVAAGPQAEVPTPENPKSLYWGMVSKRNEHTFVRHWNSFTPPEIHSYEEVDTSSHKVAEGFSDQLARLSVTALRFPTDMAFRKRYYCRAAMLETIASVPGMVSGILLHCKSLKRCEHNGGWVKAFLEEAENERMHLMTFMALQKPSWQERALIFAVQGVFFNVYLLFYLASPRFAHRMIGYLDEESIQSYTGLIRDIDSGKVPNAPAPEVAIDYWRLSKDATLRDVILAIRADEAHHRDVNHQAADVYLHGDQLKHAASCA